MSNWNYQDRQTSQGASATSYPQTGTTDPRYAAYTAQQQQQQQHQPTGRNYSQYASSGYGHEQGGAAGAADTYGSNQYSQYYADRTNFQTDTSSPSGRAAEADRATSYHHDSPLSPAPRNVSRPPPTSAPVAGQTGGYESAAQQGYYGNHSQYAQQQQHHQQQTTAAQSGHASHPAQNWQQHAQRSVSGGSAGTGVYGDSSGAYQTLSAGANGGTPTMPASAPAHQSAAAVAASANRLSGYAGQQQGYSTQQQQAYYYAQQQQQQQQQQHQQQQSHSQQPASAQSAYYSGTSYAQPSAVSASWGNQQWGNDPRYAAAAGLAQSAAGGYSQGQAQSAYSTQAQQAQHNPQYAAQLYAQQAHAQAQQAGYAGLGKRGAEDDITVVKGKKAKAGREEPAHVSPPPPPAKSLLKPPKQAGSAWQFFFAERLNEAKAQAQTGYKLNVAEVAKDAGVAYNELSTAQKDVYMRRAADAREAYKKEYTAWLATLSPDEIKRENEFRAGQRKAGKSRKGNLKDPNAPKKPLSAYFLFLKAIRSNRALTRIVFEDAEATTKQSTLAAMRWREFTPEQKAPFLRQSEADKAEYEIVRKQYDADTQARARGEDVEERPAANYSQDLVSPRLLCAVLPDGNEEDLEEVKKDATNVYKAPTKASRAEAEHEAAEAENAADVTQDISPSEENGSPAAIADHQAQGDTVIEADAPYMDISAFVPEDFAAQSTGYHLPGETENANEQHPQIKLDVPTGEENHGLDFHSVFQTTPSSNEEFAVAKGEEGALDGHAIKSETTPQVHTMSTEGVSADGSMAFSYSHSTVVSGMPSYLPHTGQQPAQTAKIEELPESANAMGEDAGASEEDESSESAQDEGQSAHDSDA